MAEESMCRPVQVACALRENGMGDYAWAALPPVILAPDQYYPSDWEPEERQGIVAWAVYVIWPGECAPELHCLRSPTGGRCELPFGAVWDVVHRVPSFRIVQHVQSYLDETDE